MRFIGFALIVVFMSFGARQASMSFDAHEAMCHGSDCAPMASEAANDVACALHCLSATAPSQASSPEVAVTTGLFLITLLVLAYGFKFENDFVPHCAGSPHFKFLQKLHLASVVIRS